MIHKMANTTMGGKKLLTKKTGFSLQRASEAQHLAERLKRLFGILLIKAFTYPNTELVWQASPYRT